MSRRGFAGLMSVMFALAAIAVPAGAQTTDRKIDYRVLATSKTSTMEKELNDGAEAGFEILGMTVGKTALGGAELVAIARKANR